MKNPLDREFSLWQLLRFAMPTVVMMVFTSLYTIVDGMFISRLVGENALAAANIAYPAISVVLAVGIMLATGGSATVARRMGAGDEEEARKNFSFLALTAAVIGVIFTLIGIFASEPISRAMGASDLLLKDCDTYLRVQMYFAPGIMLQLLFQSFFVTAGRPGLGLGLSVAAGLTNAGLDYLFMGPMHIGIAGAALATALGSMIPAVCGVLFFLFRRHGLRFCGIQVNWRMLFHSCANGASEMVTNLAVAVTTFVFNIIMMDLLGEPGVAAVSIILYAQFMLTALYLGFAMGVAPVISLNHGAENYPRLQRVFRQCIGFLLVASLATFLVSLLVARPVVVTFSPEGTEVYDIALDGFRKFAPSFLFAGINIYTSAFFTALSDGRTSALVSFARTFGFLLIGLLVLPKLLEVDGVWLAVPFAEGLCILLSVFLLRKKRNQYHYI